MLAQDGATIYTAAEEAGVDLYFEAAVAEASDHPHACANRWSATR
ncbi:MAG: hypothetical protein R2719_10510 [Micropruina sp.]